MKYMMFVLLLLPAWASAETRMVFDAMARSEVPNDEMVVNIAVERKGTDVGVLNKAVIAALKSVVSEANAVSGVNARLGTIATNPNYANNAHQGWIVRGDVVLDSRDMNALGQLAGNLGRDHQIAGVSFRLSAELRKKEESALLQQAAKNFREKAAEAANAFGFGSYEIRQITINQAGEVRPMYPSAAVASVRESASIPAARGHSEVIVTVSGITSMK